MGTKGWSKVLMTVELERNPTTRTVSSPTLRTEWGTMAGTSAISPAETRPCSSPTETSAVVGYLAIRFLLRFLANHSLKVFAYYRFGLAALVAVALLSGS